MFTLKFESGGYKFTCATHSYSVISLDGVADGLSDKSYILTAYTSLDDNLGRDFHISSGGLYDKNQQFDRVYIENQLGKTIDCLKFERIGSVNVGGVVGLSHSR